MENTGDMKKTSVSSLSTAQQSSSLSWPFSSNGFDSGTTNFKENSGQPQHSGLPATAASGGNDGMSDISNGHDINLVRENSGSISNIANNDMCSKTSYDSSISSHQAISNYDGGSRTGNAIDRTSICTLEIGDSNSRFPSFRGGTAASTSSQNSAGTSISCDRLTSLELEMTYDPHGCIYGPEGCLTPDSTWKKHLEFLAHVPE